jgi:hypothetical protein
MYFLRHTKNHSEDHFLSASSHNSPSIIIIFSSEEAVVGNVVRVMISERGFLGDLAGVTVLFLYPTVTLVTPTTTSIELAREYY